MAKTFICLVLTVVFAFLGYNSFMSNDYGPLKEWMAYYTEYKALQSALNDGNADKAEILAKLKAMYPERAKELEAKFKEKYGDLKDSAQDTQDSVHSSLADTLEKLKEDSSNATDRSTSSNAPDQDRVLQDHASRTSAPADTDTSTSRQATDKGGNSQRTSRPSASNQ